MGATVGCAQCHDHKFDPYTAQDFYSLSAFFADVDDEKHFTAGSNSNPTAREPELEVPTAEQQDSSFSELNSRSRIGKNRASGRRVVSVCRNFHSGSYSEDGSGTEAICGPVFA